MRERRRPKYTPITYLFELISRIENNWRKKQVEEQRMPEGLEDVSVTLRDTQHTRPVVDVITSTTLKYGETELIYHSNRVQV